MRRKPLGQTYPDPRRRNNFLDSCAFDPKYAPEHEAAQRIRGLGSDGQVNLGLAHSIQKEVNHPNTPPDVKQAAAKMTFTIKTGLIPDELKRKATIHQIITGNGKPENYAADAANVFEAAKYIGYFITTDEPILGKRCELQQVSGAVILKPSQWLKVFKEAADA